MKVSDLEEYRALAEQAPSMVWRSGADAKCDYCNATWLAFTGRPLEQEIGDGWTDAVHPGDLQRYLAQYWEHFARREGFETEVRLRRHDGVLRHVYVRAAPYQDPHGAFAGFLADCFDNSDVRELDVFSGGTEFFEMSLDLLSISTFDGYFKRVNPSWTKALGWSTEELMGRPLIEFVHPEDRAATLAGREGLKANEPLIGLNNRYMCKDGTYRWLEWRSVGHLEREVVYGVARDVTKQREAERVLQEAKDLQERMQRQLILSDRLASVGMLAAGVAHEINNPLAYVVANLDLLQEEIGEAVGAPTPPALVEWLEAVREAREGSDRIRKIVRGLKTLSRAEEERRSVVELRPVLELSVNMAFNEIRHRARLVKDYGETPLVEVDDARLGQVFINLIVNAAQAIPEGDSEANEIRIVTFTDTLGRAVIEVLDTGPGIPASLIGRVFDPFFTTKPIGVGTGLGLSICHSIVTSMGGEISASNREGRGARLRVVLSPAATQPEVAAVSSAKPGDASSGRAAVLVVDDERAVGVILGRVLSQHDVTTVTSAREALELIDGGRSFDLILSDLMMPGMSGMEFYDTVARERAEVAERMVFMSGGAFTPSARAFLDRVSNERLEKPFNLATIRGVVQKFVR
jgi:two-component system, cell cycle sensor histidine kinase and response regulator CckA